MTRPVVTVWSRSWGECLRMARREAAAQQVRYRVRARRDAWTGRVSWFGDPIR